ncbi:MAG: hypothetical protein R6W66_08140 [Pelovirga sp.]|jgi:hypothetical protein
MKVLGYWLLSVVLLCVVVAPAAAADSGAEGGAMVLLLLFAAFCALIVVFQLVPAFFHFVALLRKLFRPAAEGNKKTGKV